MYHNRPVYMHVLNLMFTDREIMDTFPLHVAKMSLSGIDMFLKIVRCVHY